MSEQSKNNCALEEVMHLEKLTRRHFIKLSATTGISAVATCHLIPTNACADSNLSETAHENLYWDPEPVTEALIARASELNIELIWDRGSPCRVSQRGQGGIIGMCCFRCQMGPCTLGEATGAERGACGATKEVITSRELVRRIAGGAAAHVEHARELAKALQMVGLGWIDGYRIKDNKKLRVLFDGLKCRESFNMAIAVAQKSLRDLKKDWGVPSWLEFKANEERKAVWKGLGILPTGASTEITQAQHSTTMGVDADMMNLATQGLRLGLVDGYCGLHVASNIQDVLLGTPSLVKARANLSVIDPNAINLVVHGHEPLLSEKILEHCNRHNKYYPNCERVNVVGMCCSGNELLMRKGVNLAGSMVQQELAIVTGAVEVVVVDVQCIIPNLPRVASHFHTKVVTTNARAKMPDAIHKQFTPENADKIAKEIVALAVENRANRDAKRVYIPSYPSREIMAGFSAEQITDILSAINADDPFEPLITAIKSNEIRGIAAMVGCVTPKVKFGYRHIIITRKLIEQGILVLGTGCWGHVAAQYGLLTPDQHYPGVAQNLRSVLESLAKANGLAALPACWHMGSCVDCCRMEEVINALSTKMNIPNYQLPIVASAPEFVTEKAVAIGTWAVNLGVFTHIGGQPYIAGSEKLVNLLTADLEDLLGGVFYVEEDPEVAANALIDKINEKRINLGLPI